MKIYEFCPFFNENKVAEIKIKEDAFWIDELHILEANKNFSYADKKYNFASSLLENKIVKYHMLDVTQHFRPAGQQELFYDKNICGAENFDFWYWKLLANNSGFFNEATQRNYCSTWKDIIHDNDIVILSDLDEIIDSRLANTIVDYTRKYNIITVKMYFSVFFLNLFATSNHGAKDFSYRVFVMTGKYFKTMPITSDYLRKKGIAKGLLNEIHCVDDQFSGFHHSWLVPDLHSLSKLKAFAANIKDKSIINENYIQKCIREKKLFYLNADLIVDSKKNFLRSIYDIDSNGLWCK